MQGLHELALPVSIVQIGLPPMYAMETYSRATASCVYLAVSAFGRVTPGHTSAVLKLIKCVLVCACLTDGQQHLCFAGRYNGRKRVVLLVVQVLRSTQAVMLLGGLQDTPMIQDCT